MKAETVFSLSNVSFAYRGANVLKNINLDVRRGERLGIAGESGSGKSTLLSLLLRLSVARKGTVSFYGKPLRDMTKSDVREFRRRVQPVFQDPFLSLDPAQKIESIIAEPLTSLRLVADASERMDSVIAALESVGLEADALKRRPAAFSGGERQRIAIARALVTNPEVLIADEPVSALDTVTKVEILALLRTLTGNKGFTLIMVSHDLPALADISSRIIVLDAGIIVEDAPTETLIRHPVHPRTRQLTDAVFL
jgi:peptide/nickel transport system ATP-binding protein